MLDKHFSSFSFLSFFFFNIMKSGGWGGILPILAFNFFFLSCRKLFVGTLWKWQEEGPNATVRDYWCNKNFICEPSCKYIPIIGEAFIRFIRWEVPFGIQKLWYVHDLLIFPLMGRLLNLVWWINWWQPVTYLIFCTK